MTSTDVVEPATVAPAASPTIYAAEPGLRVDAAARSSGFRPAVVLAVLFLLLLVAAALFPGALATHDPLAVNVRNGLALPSAQHLLGTDESGRDVYSRLIYGARPSLIMGFGATALGLVGGVALGLLAGMAPRVLDGAVMRVVDCVIAIPDLLLALIVITLVGAGTSSAMLAVGVAAIPGSARIIRAQTHAVKNAPYVEAASTLGLSRLTVVRRHVLPNAFRPLIPITTLRVGGAISAGAGLSFLGLGAQPPAAEWGSMISTGRSFLDNAPWLVMAPALAVTLTVLALGTVGRELKRRSEGRAIS
jgi:peptide/nickel transport system permease protein